jgi:hypothetical protein
MEPATMTSMARQITSMCPGWRTWDDGRLWHGCRAGGFLERPDDRRECHVEAADIPGLIAAIDAQAALDLAADFPGWAVTRTRHGRWIAAHDGDTAMSPTAAGLHSALCAMQRAEWW